MPKKRSLRERFEEFLDELDDDDDEPRGRRSNATDDSEDVITLRGPAARKLLGLIDDDGKKGDGDDDAKGDGDDGKKGDGDDGNGEGAPDRGRRYFKQ